ncbi:hypothetical protein CO731_00584 [Aminobacter sp. MSH1]|uniref:Uncharacterized protein n=1 Tax=Aminobacter niigataensis TaxID=83265 RepID=A0ABR6L3C6_9HYPH|nr:MULTISPECIES: hypothetical protein [Aminobacter]AWC21142.1 hypothetical protein CO731_00584 [Aminobacter sp. MSH1]MBB4651302.1 hypothetical protein [Aminobacter niigataensis]
MVRSITPRLNQDSADLPAESNPLQAAVHLAVDLGLASPWVADGSDLLPDSGPTLAPAPVPATDHAALGEIFADALFGEVIEISDLIPHLLAPAADLAGSAPVDVVVAEMAGDTAVAMVPFTILFEEDGSSGHGTL